MRWRLIGPFRAGRVTVVAGAADPNIYYFGTPGGGVWKTTDGGQVWRPIFDKERVASIGACGSSVGFQRSLCRNRGTDARKRRLSLDERRRYVDERGAAGRALHPGDHSRPQKSRSCRSRWKLGRLWTALAATSGNGKNREPRNLPHRRRRQELDQSIFAGRLNWGRRPMFRSRRPSHYVRSGLSSRIRHWRFRDGSHFRHREVQRRRFDLDSSCQHRTA